MNDDAAIHLASLMCSRLCHDLLSPVGALSNGLELLADETDPEMRARCFELVEQSAATSAAKLKFFRLAFGAAGGFGESVNVSEAREVIAALAHEARRIEVHWAVDVDTLPKPAIKVLLNLALIAIDALVRGGTLAIGAERRDGSHEVVVRAEGDRIAFDPDIGRALANDIPADGLSGRTAPAFLIAQLAHARGGALQYNVEAKALVLGAVLPEGPPAMDGAIGGMIG